MMRGGSIKRDLLRRFGIDLNNGASLKAQDKGGPSGGTNTHHRDADDILDLSGEQLRRIRRQLLREATAGLPSDRLQRSRPVFLGHAGKVDIHHDNPGQKPHHHQKPDRHAEITMKDDNDLPDDGSRIDRPHLHRPSTLCQPRKPAPFAG